MLCLECGARTRVTGIRTSFENERYRKCLKCEVSFTTVERVMGVVKSQTYFLSKNMDTQGDVLNKTLHC